MKPGKVLKILLVIYLAGGIAMYFLQELLMFHPKPLAQDHVFRFDQPFTEVNLTTPDKRNLNLVKFHAQSLKGVVLYFHGNRQNIERYARYAAYFTKNNYEVWMIDYPGYGKSTGKRSEQILYDDALLFYETAQEKISPEKIIIYGKSLGTGVASFLASKKDCRQLILETPYYSMLALAKHYFPLYPVSKLVRYTFPTHQYLKQVNAPITIFHGTSDGVIPYKHSEKLKEENPQLNLISVPGGEHNNLFNFSLVRKKLDSLLQ